MGAELRLVAAGRLGGGRSSGHLLIASSLLILGVRIAPLRANWLQGISGLWLIIGSFVLLFNHLSKASLNSLIVGALVLTVSVAAMWSLTRQSA